MKNITKSLSSLVEVGKIGRAYGVLGWVRIISFTCKIDSIFYYRPWFVYFQKQWRVFFLDQWKLIGNHSCIVKIKGISNRESAKLLTHCKLMVDSKQFPCLCDDEYYYKDLMQCMVITIQDEILGYVTDIIDTTANDVLVVTSNKLSDSLIKKKDCLIPFLNNKVIKDVNLTTRTIVVDWDVNF